MQLYYPVDKAICEYQPRLPVSDIRELNAQMNCNLEFSDENEVWLNQENENYMMTVVDENWFFEYV